MIHDWNDARSISILRNCHQALPSCGKLLLVERLMPESPGMTDEDKAHAMSDLNMMRGPAAASAPRANIANCSGKTASHWLWSIQRGAST